VFLIGARVVIDDNERERERERGRDRWHSLKGPRTFTSSQLRREAARGLACAVCKSRTERTRDIGERNRGRRAEVVDERKRKSRGESQSSGSIDAAETNDSAAASGAANAKNLNDQHTLRPSLYDANTNRRARCSVLPRRSSASGSGTKDRGCVAWRSASISVLASVKAIQLRVSDSDSDPA